MTRVALLVCAFTSCFAPALSAAAPSLNFFKNYFVTGDYATGSVKLRGTGVGGTATGAITMSVPQNMDLVAAFLYWETIEKTPDSGSVGYFGAPGVYKNQRIVGKAAKNTPTSPCWSSGGGSGASNGVTNLRVYRADVLRYLYDPTAKKRIADGTYMVQLPDAGTGNQVPATNGATLVVVYRNPAPNATYRGVVLYDGALTIDNATQSYSQTFEGFYQADPGAGAGRVTYIVGDAQPNFGENLTVNGTTYPNQFNGPYWDTLDFDPKLLANAGSFLSTINHQGSTFDCLSLGAVVISTPVKDTDKDGLLDTWEENGFKDVNGTTTLNLKAMGASPTVKDIFIEIDHMVGVNHSHKPKPEALQKVVDAFSARNINVHFDVGPPSAGGQGGGQPITELPTAAPRFPLEPGVVGWKSGFSSLKDGGTNPQNALFAKERRHIFHYAIFGHSLGIPALAPDPSDTTRSTSGIADLPGGDFMVTLGKWRSDIPSDDQVGSVLQQAGTLMHELGHNLNLRHGGTEDRGCKPNYQSVMNYLFQSRGLVDGNGNYQVDYSSQGNLLPLNESLLSEATGIGAAKYLTRWYAPPGNSIDAWLAEPSTRYAKRSCDGTLATVPVILAQESDTRVAGQARAIDWDNSGSIQLTGNQSGDINFSNAFEVDLGSSDDWSAIDLRQLGARRGARGLSGDIASGDIASGDIASGDIASGDIASGDIASGDIASGDIASGQIPYGDIASDLDFTNYSANSSPPTSLAVTFGSKANSLTWSRPGQSQVVEYWVYRAIAEVNSTTVTRIGKITSPQFTDTDVKGGTTYYYFVTAMGPNNTQSAASNIVTNKKGK